LDLVALTQEMQARLARDKQVAVMVLVVVVVVELVLEMVKMVVLLETTE
jgi:hypothetical protein